VITLPQGERPEHVRRFLAGAKEGTTELFVLRSDTESTMVPERAARQDVRERIEVVTSWPNS
jgi:hypothetical protein